MKGETANTGSEALTKIKLAIVNKTAFCYNFPAKRIIQ
jgi:hypothetical protein